MYINRTDSRNPSIPVSSKRPAGTQKESFADAIEQALIVDAVEITNTKKEKNSGDAYRSKKDAEEEAKAETKAKSDAEKSDTVNVTV